VSPWFPEAWLWCCWLHYSPGRPGQQSYGLSPDERAEYNTLVKFLKHVEPDSTTGSRCHESACRNSRKGKDRGPENPARVCEDSLRAHNSLMAKPFQPIGLATGHASFNGPSTTHPSPLLLYRGSSVARVMCPVVCVGLVVDPDDYNGQNTWFVGSVVEEFGKPRMPARTGRKSPPTSKTLPSPRLPWRPQTMTSCTPALERACSVST